MAHRFHIVQEFNKGIYDYIIATDEGGGKVEVDSCDEKDEKLSSGAEAAEHCESTLPSVRIWCLTVLLLNSCCNPTYIRSLGLGSRPG